MIDARETELLTNALHQDKVKGILSFHFLLNYLLTILHRYSSYISSMTTDTPQLSDDVLNKDSKLTLSGTIILDDCWKRGNYFQKVFFH